MSIDPTRVVERFISDARVGDYYGERDEEEDRRDYALAALDEIKASLGQIRPWFPPAITRKEQRQAYREATTKPLPKPRAGLVRYSLPGSPTESATADDSQEDAAAA